MKDIRISIRLSEEEQQTFEYIYTDATYQQYLFYEKQVTEFKEARNKLLLNISQDREVFPFKQNEILESLNISDDLKEFMQMITLKSNNINNTHKSNKK